MQGKWTVTYILTQSYTLAPLAVSCLMNSSETACLHDRHAVGLSPNLNSACVLHP